MTRRLEQTLRLAVAAALAALLVTTHPRSALACGEAFDCLSTRDAALVIGTAALVFGADLAFTIHDSTVDRSSAGAGIFETLVAGPQLALGIAWTATGGGIGAALYSAWMAGLTAHGVYAIARAITSPGESDGEGHLPPESFSAPHAGLGDDPGVSKPIAALPRHSRPKLNLSLALVNVGQRSAPGFGVVGRF